MKIKFQVLTVLSLVLCTNFTIAEGNNSIDDKNQSQYLKPISVPVLEMESQDPNGNVLEAGTIINIDDFKLNNDNTFSANTTTATSLTVHTKYLLKPNSKILGSCASNQFAFIQEINGVKVINQRDSEMNSQIANEQIMNTTCGQINGTAKSILITDDIKLSGNGEIKVPRFNQDLKFKESGNKYFDILSIETNGYQMKINYKNIPDTVPVFGKYDTKNQFSSFNYYPTELKASDTVDTVIIDGNYNPVLISNGDPEKLQVVTITKIQ